MDTFRERLAQNCRRRTIWIADAHRGDGKGFVAHADEKLTAFLEIESEIRVGSGELGIDKLPRFLPNSVSLDES
jgi:hypothetical protein